MITRRQLNTQLNLLHLLVLMALRQSVDSFLCCRARLLDSQWRRIAEVGSKPSNLFDHWQECMCEGDGGGFEGLGN